MAESPWIKFYTSDFLTGVADLQADEIGIYTVLLALIWDKGGPIADDSAWLARRAGTSTRRFNQVRARLIELGKLEARNGLLANRRALDEMAKRDGKSAQARNAAMVRWKAEGEPELPLDQDQKPVGTKDAPRARARSGDYLGKNGEKNGRNSQDKDVLFSGNNQQEPQKPAIPDDADACFPSRAGAFQSPEVRITPHPDSTPEPPRPSRLDDTDLQALYHAVCDASGFNPSNPGQINLAYAKVEAWRDAGISFDEVVVPTIQAAVANSSDPTRTLGRFDKAVRHEHARRSAKAATGKPYTPPPSPILEPDDEDAMFRPLRAALLAEVGGASFSSFYNGVRFSERIVGNAPNTRRLIDVNGGFMARHVRDDARFAQIVRKHGFSGVT